MSRIVDWYFPFSLAALVLCGTSLFPLVFNPSTRWLLLLFTFILVFSIPSGKIARNSKLFYVIIVYLIWSFLTIFWSEVPHLSAYKVLAEILVLVGMFLLGFIWMTRQKRIRDALKSFYWYVPSVLLVAVSGRVEQGGGLFEQGRHYYSGLAGNPNFLGWMMAVCLPVLIWKVFDPKLSPKYRLLFLSLMGICGYYLLLSQSRTSMMLAFCGVLGFFIASRIKTRVRIITLSLFLLLGTILAVTNLSGLVYSKYILKGTGGSLSSAVDASRGEPFKLSYAAALKGGVMGVGYGISAGANPDKYKGGLTAVGYGREKGSSPLAVVEETGVIGFILTFTFILHLFVTAFKAYASTANAESKAIIGLLTGLLVGFLVQSNLEAWWVAPGSPESMFFWGLSGMSYALFRLVKSQSRARKLTDYCGYNELGEGEQRFPLSVCGRCKQQGICITKNHGMEGHSPTRAG